LNTGFYANIAELLSSGLTMDVLSEHSWSLFIIDDAEKPRND
jgi:hypothetical protein